MKSIIKLSIWFFCLIFVQTASSQKTVDEFFSQADAVKNITIVKLSGEILRSIGKTESNTNNPNSMAQLTKGIEGIVSIVDDSRNAISVSKLEGLALSDGLVEYISVKDAEKTVKIYTGRKISEGVYHNVLLVAQENSQNLLIKIDGKVDLDNLAKLGDKIKVKGFDAFRKVKK